MNAKRNLFPPQLKRSDAFKIWRSPMPMVERDAVEDEMDRKFMEWDRSAALAHRISERNEPFMIALGKELGVNMELVQTRVADAERERQAFSKKLEPTAPPGTPVDELTPEPTFGCSVCQKYGPPIGAVSEFAHSDFITVKLCDLAAFNSETEEEAQERNRVRECYMNHFGHIGVDCIDC